MVSIRPKERSETDDVPADNRPFQLRDYELQPVVGTYGRLRRHSRTFLGKSMPTEAAIPWESNWCGPLKHPYSASSLRC